MAEMSGHDRHDNVWVDFSVDFSKWKGWAVMLVSLNMMAFRLLWNWSLESLVGLLTDSIRPHTVCRLFHFKNGPLNLSKSEQFASPQGKLLPCLKTLFTMFLVLLAQFSQIISGEKHSLSSFTPTRISKFHASWRLTCMQTRNFKDFLNTLYKSCFFRSWRDTHLGNNFLWGRVISIFTPSSHWELFISVCCQTTYQTDVMNNFLRANIIQEEFNLLQMEQVDSWLHPSLVCERFLALRCSLTSPLVASLTSSQIYKHILALKEFSQTTYVFVCSGRRLFSLNYS